MRSWKYLVLAVAAGFLLYASPWSSVPQANAQVSFGVSIGAPPVCPYGYYDFAPYNCAPYGYYGPEWFTNGVFIGAGPWFHGPHGFHGHVDNHFDPNHGYHGAFPARGEHPVHNAPPSHFHGNEMRAGEGHGGAPHGGDHR
jgi:hypothetical protein